MRIDPPMTSPPAATAPTPATRPVAALFAIPPTLALRSVLADEAGPLPTPAPTLPLPAAPIPTPAPAAPLLPTPGLVPASGPTPALTSPMGTVPLPLPGPLPDRVTWTPVAHLPRGIEFRTRTLQAILQSLGGGRALPAQFQILLRDETSAYSPPAMGGASLSGGPTTPSPAPVALLQSTLQLETAPGQTLPARLTLALMPALVAARPELAEALRQRLLDDQPLPMKLDAAPAELAGQRLLFEFTDPRAQWSMQALAMRGLLVVGQPEKLRGKPVWRLPDDEPEDEQEAPAEAAIPPYALADDGGPPRISTLRWASLLLVPLFAKLRALLR
jgi:hypothetical protein